MDHSQKTISCDTKQFLENVSELTFNSSTGLTEPILNLGSNPKRKLCSHVAGNEGSDYDFKPYGQDAAAVETCTDVNGLAIIIAVVADGHGFGGERLSNYMVKNLVEYFIREISKMDANHYTDQNLSKCIVDVTACMRKERFNSLPGTGTTLTVSVIINNIVITASVGDSPALLINNETTKVDMQTVSHSFENMPFYLYYLKTCRQINIRPLTAVLGRLNVDIRPPAQPRYEFNEGNPIQLYTIDGLNSIEVSEETKQAVDKIETLWPDNTGGVQSNTLLLEIDENGKKSSLYPGTNWGSTGYYLDDQDHPACGKQMASDITYLENNQPLIITTHTRQLDNSNYTLILATDGVTDTIPANIMGLHITTAIKNGNTNPAYIADKLLAESESACARDPMRFTYRDDRALVVVTIDNT